MRFQIALDAGFEFKVGHLDWDYINKGVVRVFSHLGIRFQ